MNHKTLINIIICLSIAVPCLPQITNGSSSFVINEIQTANIDQYIDYSNNYGGWIEIYNPTSSAITLDNYYISNDANNLRLHKLQNLGNIARQKFCIIYFDHNSADGNFSSTANKQVRFKLNADGGTLYISDSTGKLVTSFDYPASISRCSYARTTDGGNTWCRDGT